MPTYSLESFQEYVYYDNSMEVRVEEAKYFLSDF